jgi:L-threonylcarbamoyladenylate synthase
VSAPPYPDVVAAADALRAGELVAFPTETVYGLGADATNPLALDRLYRTKARPADHPLIVHIASSTDLDRWATHVPQSAVLLIERFWPGPLTLILERRPDVPAAVSGGLATIGLRVPNHPVALALLRAFAGGIAAPSANRFQHVSPTSAEHVRTEFTIGPGGEVAVLLDGGSCDVGVESTIIELVTDQPMILRAGAISAPEIADVIHRHVEARPSGPSRASGMLEAHYQPQARVHLAPSDDEAAAIAAELRTSGSRVMRITDPHDIVTYARQLYRLLRRADEIGADAVVAELPADAPGLAAAVRDRLARAASTAG